jgi:hypothetical protein
MAIEFNDNIHVKINRPTDFRYGPFESTAQALSLIPIAQRYHGLSFGVYTTPLDLTTSDIDCYYFYNDLSVFKPCGNESSGHIIVDDNDNELLQQPKLKFERLIVTDDDVNDQTIVARPSDTSIELTRPSSPLEGDEWTDPETFKTYKYYDGYWVELPSSGSGGGGGESDPFYIEVTYTEAVSLVNSNSLVKGATYKISGFSKNKTGTDYPNVLYDDGNDLGIAIYLVALETNKFSPKGEGEFYNPKYYGIDDYNNIDGTGLYGIWDGDNPVSENIPDYDINQVVFWGGYAWKNLTGDVGTSEDVITLDSTNWEKLSYSDTDWYEKVIDLIEVDFENDYLISRRSVKPNIEVKNLKFSAYLVLDITNLVHPIAVMQWSNNVTTPLYMTYNISSNESYFETINLKGYCHNVSLKESAIYDNYIGSRSGLEGCRFNSFCLIVNCSLINFSSFTEFDFLSSTFYNVSLSNSSFIRFIFTGTDLNLATTSTITNKTSFYLQANEANINQNMNSATRIFGTYYKLIFEREDGTSRLGYYNNSNVFTVVNLNA